MTLQALRDACPEITLIDPSSPDWETTRKVFLSSTATPVAIARPKNGHEVGRLVKAAVKHGFKFTIRSGGHDLVGRSIVQDTLTIDVRDINFVHVSEDRQNARIGGGVSLMQLAEGLQEHGLVTPIGSVPAIGYAGWATLGGYGCLTNHFGLGVDQIVGAEVVDWEGNLVTADSDRLKGIRGAGGNFGVICSLTVKVYPLKSVLSGNILFNPGNLTANLQQTYGAIQKGFGEIPCELQLQPMVMYIPNAGTAMGIVITWSSSDMMQGRQVLEKLLSMLPAVMANSIEEKSLTQYLHEVDQILPRTIYGFDQTVSLERFDEDVLEILGRHAEKMPPDPSTLMSLHGLMSNSPSADPTVDRDSVFAANVPHTVVELIGSVVDPANLEKSKAWSVACRDELRTTGKPMERTYISLTGPGDRSLQQVYGKKWDELIRLKDKFDPQGVFDLSVPRIRTGST